MKYSYEAYLFLRCFEIPFAFVLVRAKYNSSVFQV